MPYTQNPQDLDLISDVNLILSNEEGAYAAVRAAALESVHNDDAALNDKDAYEIAFDDGNSDWETLCEAAGIAVRDAVLDLIDGTVGIALDLLRQRLDLNNKHAWACIAEGFMPDPDDVWDDAPVEATHGPCSHPLCAGD